jgi:3-deoxy-7-phosphoheptulonate synthase
VEDTRIGDVRPLISPACLAEDIPLSEKAKNTVLAARAATAACIEGADDRLVVIVGPCSIHDPTAALEYAKRLAPLVEQYSKELVVIMRVYFEKPRTTVGWKGLINDPNLDGSYNINKGLRMARQLLVDVNELGVPAGTEFLDTISPQYTADTIAWGAIGARTTESQLHRELASGLSCPIGFKNGTSGAMQIAVDAIRAAACPHYFMGVTHQGLAGIVGTKGNPHCHIIHRGGSDGPNFSAEHVKSTCAQLAKVKLGEKVMIDCSHANSSKKHENQPIVAKDIAGQLQNGDKAIFGVMLESNINEGRQDLVEGQADKLKYGVSITDACINWDTTVATLQVLADGVKARRK